jgi:GT2 family glycosyltransferase
LYRDLLPALELVGCEHELIVIDNSPTRLDRLADAVKLAAGRYCWQLGENLMYGPALNLAVSLSAGEYLLYVCANHGEAFDPTWAQDLLAPFDDPGVAMTGCLQSSGAPQAQGFPPELFDAHVQGGVFGARTAVLREHPYDEGEYQHWGADVNLCFRLSQAGYGLADVPTVRSVWREDPGEGDWKYLHCGG